jgi:twitching motility protein PilU
MASSSQYSNIAPYLKLMVDHGASDLFFSVGARPKVKVESAVRSVGQDVMTPESMRLLLGDVLDAEQQQQFHDTLEFNSGFSVAGIGRFRLYVFRQRGEPSMVVRYVRQSVPSIAELGLPQTLERLVMEKRGLILVVGATGCGKSTTLAAMIDHRNTHSTGHILTIEDPIEIVHNHKRSVVDQREVGIDTLSYGEALKNALRGAPDLIMIGEVRDAETMQHALRFAETGHLCLATLHATNSTHAVERVINFFPEESKNRLLGDLSLNLKAIVAQRLLPGKEGVRVAAVEVLLRTPHTVELIEKGKIHEMRELMAKRTAEGIQTFDEAVFKLWQDGRVEARDAVRYAESEHEVRMRIEFAKPGTFASVAPEELSLNVE